MRFRECFIAAWVMVSAVPCIASERPEPVSYDNIFKVESSRVGGYMLRYIKTYRGSCFYVEVLEPDRSWRIKDSKKICGIDGKLFSTDFADAGFQNIKFGVGGVDLELYVTPLRAPGEILRQCKIALHNGVLGELNCADERTF